MPQQSSYRGSTFLSTRASVNCVNGDVSDGQRVVFDAAIKAQWSYHCFVMLLKPAELHFFFCPSADCAMLFGSMVPTERRHAETLDQTDDGNDEETEEDEECHETPP